MMNKLQQTKQPRIDVGFARKTGRLLALSLLGLGLQSCGGSGVADNSALAPKPTNISLNTQASGLALPKVATASAPVAPKSLAVAANLVTDCSGANCGAVTPSVYSGKGVGLWKYNNTSTNNVSINVDIAGVSAGKQVTLSFTNGNATTVASKPSFGNPVALEIKPSTPTTSAETFYNTTAATIGRTMAERAMHEQHSKSEAAHASMIDKNAAVRQRHLISDSTGSLKAEAILNPLAKPQATPAVNATRTWADFFPTTPVKYATTNRYVCALPSGRNVVFWQETKDTQLTPALLKLFTDKSCGSSGMFSRLNTLLGDVWGKNPYTSQLIQDSAQAKQDINIVFMNAGSTVGWGGYFYSLNNFYSTSASPTNQALAFFINTDNLATNPNYYISVLAHEATHMTAYYQNDIVRGKYWGNTWLDETFAMMSEDIVVPAVINTNTVASYRLPYYMASGGNVSLNNWAALSHNNYAMGGSLGAFLNRQYGLSIYQQLITGCTSGTAKADDYTCLNSLILNNGGTGLGDELAKMGSSVFSKASATTNLKGYGYPSKASGAYTLQAIDLQALAVAAPTTLTAYQSMSHTYAKDTIAAGKTRYTRNTVIVPAKTSLNVVIK